MTAYDLPARGASWACGPVELSTAQRYDLLIEPDELGTFVVPSHFKHSVQGNEYGRADTITVHDGGQTAGADGDTDAPDGRTVTVGAVASAQGRAGSTYRPGQRCSGTT